MVAPVDKSPSHLDYILGVKCTHCGLFKSLYELKERSGTIFEYSCERWDGGEFVPVLDMDRLRPILDPHIAHIAGKERDVAQERFKTHPSYFIFPELLPLIWDHGKPRIYVEDIPFSPLDKSTKIGHELGVSQLYFLDDGRLLTGSFKDRAVNMAVNITKESGCYTTIYNASTGNLVIACLEIGAKAGMDVYALLPQALSEGKRKKIEEVVQAVRKYGHTVKVSYFDHDYTTINDTIAERLIDDHNNGKEFLEAFSPNRGPRTWYGMGEWTAAFQLVTQLYYQHGIERGVPINIYIGGGSGKLTSMVTEACKVLQELHILDNPIRVWSVQPDIHQPLVEGYNTQVLPKLQQGLTYEDIKDDLNLVIGKNPQGTIVEEVAIKTPGSFLHTMKSLAHPNSSERKEWKAVRGGAIAIDDRKTLDGTIELALKEGKTPQFVGGMAYQGFRQAIAQNPGLRNEIHVVYLTGGGKGKMRQTLEQMARNELWGRREELLKIAPLF